MSEMETVSIVATAVTNASERLNFLPTYFGPRSMMHGEAFVFDWMGRISTNYKGGFWDYYILSNDGFYMAPSLSIPLEISIFGNGFSGTLSADAAGIVATLFALNQLIHELFGLGDLRADDCEALIGRYEALKDFVCQHDEAAKIFAAID